MRSYALLLQWLLAFWSVSSIQGFTQLSHSHQQWALKASSSTEKDPNEIIAKRITLTGDVNGGYYRACVKNQVSFSEFVYK